MFLMKTVANYPLIIIRYPPHLFPCIYMISFAFQQQVDESSIQLGPGGGASRFAGWGRGSTGGGARASQEKERPPAPSNR